MTIRSSIRELGVFDLFQILHLHRKTGRLIISEIQGGGEAQVLFKDGSVCFAAIHEKVAGSMESLLFEWGILDQESLERVERELENYESLFACLEGEGIATRTYLENYVTTRVRECVYEIFKLESGECLFIEEDRDERRELLLHLNTENLILEAARRIDEWSNIRSKVPSRHSVFRLCEVSKEGQQQLNLKPREWEILSLIDGARSVDEVNSEVGGELFSTSKLIYGLIVMGVIEVVDDSKGKNAKGSAKEKNIRRLLESGKEYYDKLNLDKAAAEFEKTLQIDKDCFEALRMLGEIYYKIDRLSESLVYLRRARSLNPNNQKTMFVKGYLHARMGEVSHAIKEWEELERKTENHKILELVRSRLSVAKEWEKILQEY